MGTRKFIFAVSGSGDVQAATVAAIGAVIGFRFAPVDGKSPLWYTVVEVKSEHFMQEILRRCEEAGLVSGIENVAAFTSALERL
jgi:hypothetical protein